MKPEDLDSLSHDNLRKMDLKDKIVAISQGNIGVLKVLIEIAKTDEVFLNPLGIAIDLTHSKSYGIWIIYKNICNSDIEETKKVLASWFDNSLEPLEKFLEDAGLQ